jgi:hypothetical protein
LFSFKDCHSERSEESVSFSAEKPNPYGGSVQPMMLLFSVVLGILPLLGIVWTIMNGTITTVDGLFMTLILLSLSGLFFLNAFWECRDCGYIPGKKNATPAKK